MEIDNLENINPDDYSWFKVHFKNFLKSLKILWFGIIKNFRRITWHSKRGLVWEYIQVVCILIFITLFCFCIFYLASHLGGKG